MQSLAPLGPEVMQELNISDYITRLAGSLGIDTEGLVKSEEQKQLEAQEAQAAQAQMVNQQTMGKLAEKAMPEMAKSMSQSGMGEEPPPPQMNN